MKLKATNAFKDLDNKFFGVHKVKQLEAGGVVEVTSPDNIPTEVMATLEEVDKKKVVKNTTKGDK